MSETKPSFRFPKALFMVGDPTEAPPYRDATIIQKFVKEEPDWAIVILVDNDEERAKVGEKLKSVQFPEFHPGGLVAAWTNDSEMMDLLINDMHFLDTWAVVAPAWYSCPDGHEAASTLKAPLTECPTCKKSPLTYHRMNEEKHEKFKEIVKSAHALVRFDTRSGKHLETMSDPTGNVLRNMPYALGLPEAPALKLEDFHLKGRGKAAFVVSAGPSLKRALPHLKRLQEEAIIVAVGRVVRLLHEHGIRMDYAFSCEMMDWDSVIFDGVTKEMIGDAILCYPPVCAPATVAKWPGRRLCTFDPNTSELVKSPMSMMGGNSVSHHMLNFAAQILHCEPIILVGQDLGYTEQGEVTHADGSGQVYPDAVQHEDTHFQAEDWGECTSNTEGPFVPMHHRQQVFLQGGIAPVGPVLVRTSPSYKCFRDLFNILIKRHRRKVYNACPNGLKIHEAEYLNLAKTESLLPLADRAYAALG